MKLKNTVSGAELPLIGNDWSLIPDQPPDKWIDVTEECFVEEGERARILHKVTGGTSDVRQAYWYRITKVQFKRDLKLPPGTGMIPHPQETVWAFIVEHRERS